MEEPTVYEMLRDLQADVQRLLADREQYVSKEILTLQLEALSKEQARDRAKLDAISRWFWSAVTGPVIVGVILYMLIGKSP